MNKRTRLVVSVLFAVLIILAAAITRFYVNVPESINNKEKQTEIAEILANDGSGYSVFSDGKGSVGVAKSGRIVAAPEWKELTFAGHGMCIASKRLDGRVLCGCIDYDGNVCVPLVYDRIEELTVGNTVFYAAESAGEGSVVLYDENFVPCFRTAWDSCEVTDDDLILTKGSGTYVYTPAPEGLLFKSAAVSGQVMDSSYELKITSRVMLSKLSVPMIEKMVSDTERYFRYAFTGDEAALPENVPAVRFTRLFGGEEKVISRRLRKLTDIYIYSVNASSDEQVFEVAASAETEIIYSGDRGRRERLDQRVKAAVRFRGSSESNLEVISGSFDKAVPDYPKPQSEETGTADGQKQISGSAG